MTDRTRNALIGLFVFGGLVALGILIVKFGEAGRLWGRGHVISALFDEVPNIRDGSEVRLAGVRVGRVLKVDLVDPSRPHAGVSVDMQIDRRYTIWKDSRAIIVPPLMGQPYVNIIPPLTPVEALDPEVRATIHGSVQGPLSDIIDPELMDNLVLTTDEIRRLARALTPAAEAFTQLLEPRSIAELETAPDLAPNLATAVERLHNVLMHMESALADEGVRRDLKETIANFRETSDGFKEVMKGVRDIVDSTRVTATSAGALVERLDATVDTTHQHIDVLGRKLADNLDQISKLLDYMNAAGRDLAEGDGSAGMLLRDPQLYDAMLLTVQRLGEAAADMKVLVRKWQEHGILAR